MSPRTPYIDPNELKRLSKLEPWKTVSAYLFDVGVIALAITLCEITKSWIIWLIAVPVIAGRMHAIAGLIHEFAHYRFISNKALSDWIGDLFMAWPIGTTVDGYRQNHLAHHRYTNSEDDPDWTAKLGTRAYTFPQRMRYAILNFLGYVVAISSVRDMGMAAGRMQGDHARNHSYLVLRAVYYLAVLAAVTYFGVWPEYLLYWIVPYTTFFFLFMYIRSVAEHFGETMVPDSELNGTRTVIPHAWEYLFFCPHNLNYHLEHHLYPSVPFYNLPALQRELMKNNRFATESHLTRGYVTGLLREVWLDGWNNRSPGRIASA